ncbi:MAG: PTS sugar transporter subunit IIA [Candidatus Cloacimonadales bacterium]|nr:PTS sugar transporter subunit IIA [Candidatus Cloacimonadales bacterium]
MWKKSIDRNLVVIDPPVKNKMELFEGLVNHVYNHDYIRNKKKFLQALLDREEMANTELAPGIALPHARTNATEKLFVSIIISREGIDYDNPEMGPAKIIFFFGCNENQNREYLQLLAKSNRILKKKDFKEKLLNCETSDQVVDLLNEYDDEEQTEEDAGNFLLILTLNEPDKSEEVMSAMVELGITNASILDATSMAKKLAYEMPVFAGLSYMAQGKSQHSNLIFAHIEYRDIARKLANLLKENGIDLNKTGVGFIQTIKVENIIGNFEEDIEL